MWYKKGKTSGGKVDPILTEQNGNTYILLPQIEQGSYDVIGYNWMDIETGEYNSCCTWPTVEKAVEDYGGKDQMCDGEIKKL